MERSLKGCQDRPLDILGPLSRILDMAEECHINDTPLDTDLFRGWSQRALVLLVNASLNIERRRVILTKINPKLGDMAEKEPSQNPKGLLFGEDMIKSIGKYISTFTDLDKAQANMRRVFNSNLFGRGGRRDLSSGRGSQRPFSRLRGSGRGFFPSNPPFYLQRGRGSRNRGFRSRGTPNANVQSMYSSYPFFSPPQR